MALLEGRDHFETIRNCTRFSLLLPEKGATHASAVLYLLPVCRGLATDWVRYTNIELWAKERNLAVIMPEGVCSDFCNMQYGMKWWDYLTQELPEYLRQVFGVADDHLLCFGAEMGALGSLKLGLIHPERFMKAGAVTTDFLRISRYSMGEINDHDLECIYGESPVPEDILNQCDPIRIATSCKHSNATLFLSRMDSGAENIASTCGRPVVWLSHNAAGWEDYGECLKEFLDNVNV